MRVLVVEDEQAISRPLAEGLRREGSMSTRLVAPPTVDVVLLDLRLPDGAGLGVCRSLRAEAASRSFRQRPTRRG